MMRTPEKEIARQFWGAIIVSLICLIFTLSAVAAGAQGKEKGVDLDPLRPADTSR